MAKRSGNTVRKQADKAITVVPGRSAARVTDDKLTLSPLPAREFSSVPGVTVSQASASAITTITTTYAAALTRLAKR